MRTSKRTTRGTCRSFERTTPTDRRTRSARDATDRLSVCRRQREREREQACACFVAVIFVVVIVRPMCVVTGYQALQRQRMQTLASLTIRERHFLTTLKVPFRPQNFSSWEQKLKLVVSQFSEQRDRCLPVSLLTKFSLLVEFRSKFVS